MKTLAAVALITSLLSFRSCDEIFSILNGGGLPDPITSYPLQPGNRWQYTRNFWSHNFRPLVPGAIDPHENYLSYYDIEITGVRRIPRRPSTRGDSITVTELRQIERDGIQTFPSAYLYLKQESDGLYMHGYTGSTMGAPRPPARPEVWYVFAEKRYGSLKELAASFAEPLPGDNTDSLTREYPTLKSIQYPLSNGNQWTFRPRGRPWRIDKLAGPMISAVVLGRQVRYHEVRWLYDMDGNGLWDNNFSFIDRISDKGMIKRTIEFKDILVTDEGHPEGVGKIDITDESSITSMNVP